MTSFLITLTREEVDCIEDAFFTDLTSEEYNKIRPVILEVWNKIMDGVDNG